jgi:hypothetical protein
MELAMATEQGSARLNLFFDNVQRSRRNGSIPATWTIDAEDEITTMFGINGFVFVCTHGSHNRKAMQLISSLAKKCFGTYEMLLASNTTTVTPMVGGYGDIA